jgi:small multidrug resistance family-3 protein
LLPLIHFQRGLDSIVTLHIIFGQQGEEGADVLQIQSFLYFLLAGLCEISGGYLVWLWLRENKSLWYAVIGALILVLYGIIPTFQPANFGRVYAAYGGVFVVLSLLWGWMVDCVLPDKFDFLGGFVALLGVAIIMYWPRG